MSSPLLYQGVLYTVANGGILTALDPHTGEVLKAGRLDGALEDYYASPVAAAGKLFVASGNGKIVVVKAGADWSIVAVNDLGQECYASPALSEGDIIVRTANTLFNFGCR